MAVTGPDFVSLQVRDLERSAAFYEQYLGLKRSDAGPPHAVVFGTKPIAFAVRNVVAGTDLDAIASRGREWRCGCTPPTRRTSTTPSPPPAQRSSQRPSTGRSAAPSRSRTPTATGDPPRPRLSVLACGATGPCAPASATDSPVPPRRTGRTRTRHPHRNPAQGSRPGLLD